MKHAIQRGDVVYDQRLLVALECRPQLGHDLRQVDVHRISPRLSLYVGGIGAAAMPMRSSA
jgi:hypothetical protein